METSSTNDYVKSVTEALLFISEKPLGLDQIKSVLESAGGAEIKRAIKELMEEYQTQGRGMSIVEIAGGYQMLSNPSYASYIRSFFKTRVKEKLSRPSLEALAIVAYKQPVCRNDIEVIRGVNSDGVVVNLEEKGLIKIVGRKDVPGRPYLYGTTKLFLEYFGLKSLNDLPALEDFSGLVAERSEGEVLPMHDNHVVPTREEVIETDSSRDKKAEAELPEEGVQQQVNISKESASEEDSEEKSSINSQQVSQDDSASQETEQMEEASRLKEVMDEINKEETPQMKE